MRRDEWATSAPMSFAVAGVVMMAGLATVIMSTADLAGGDSSDELEATNLNGQAEGLLRLLLESPGYVGAAGWDPAAGHDADDVSRLGLLRPGGQFLDQAKFENLRLAAMEAGDDNRVNYPEARTKLGLTSQGLDFHIRAYPSLLEVRDRLALGIKDTNMRVAYIGHVEGSVQTGGGTPPTLGALTCTKAAGDADHYRYEIDVGGLNQYTHVSVSLGIRKGGTGPSVEATDVTEIAPSNGYTARAKIDVPNFGNVGCDPTTEVAVAVSDPSLTLVSTTLTPSLVAPGPTGASARNFQISAALKPYLEGTTVSVGYSGVAQDDKVQWAVYDAATGDPVAVAGIQNPSTITVPNNGQDRWFSFTAPDVATTGFYRVEAIHTPKNGGATEMAVRHFAVHDGAITIQPYTDPSGGATTATDPMKYEVRWIHDISERFCAQTSHDAGLVHMYDGGGDPTAAELATQVSDQCNTRVNLGYGGFPALNAVGRSGDVYYDTKTSANSLCRVLLAGQAVGQCQWQTAPATLEYLNVLVIGSEVAHNNLVANDFKKSVAKWVDAGGTLIVFGSSDSRQWMQSGLGIGHASSSGSISSPDPTHPILARPNQLDWANYDDTQEQWNVDGQNFTPVIKQGGYPVTTVSNPGSYQQGNIFLTTWQPYNIYGTGPGTAPDEGRGLMDNMLSLSYRDLYMDYGPQLPINAPAVPALGRGLIDHDKLGLIEMDFIMYVFKGGGY